MITKDQKKLILGKKHHKKEPYDLQTVNRQKKIIFLYCCYKSSKKLTSEYLVYMET